MRTLSARQQRWVFLIVVAGFTFVIGLLAQARATGVGAALHSAELFIYDKRMQTLPRREPDPSVVIVAIDSASTGDDRLGRWPWPRSVHARLIDRMREAGAAAVVFDVSFEGASGKSAVDLQEDAALAGACARFQGHVVVARSLHWDDRSNQFDLDVLPPGLEEQVEYGGVGATRDSDGVMRRSILQETHDSVTLDALWIKALQVSEGKGLQYDAVGRIYQVGTHRIPVATAEGVERGMLLNFPGRAWPVYSYASVLGVGEPPPDPAVFRGKIVLVGSTTDPNDRYRVPRDDQGDYGDLPGVMAQHAAALDTVLSGLYLRRPFWDAGERFGQFLIFCLVVGGILFATTLGLSEIGRKLKLVHAAFLGLALAVSWAVVAWGLFLTQRLVMAVVVPELMVLLPLGFVALYDTWASRRALGRFLPAADVEQMISSPELLQEQKTRVATIMFVDLRDYTTLSEGRQPDEVRSLVAAFHTALGEVVQKHGGYVCDFQGDAQMVCFGLDGKRDHAGAAIKAAMDIPDRIRRLNQEVSPDRPLFRAGVGICTGQVSVGYLGAGGKAQHTVLGDTTNTAARLQGKARDLGVVTIVSATTVDAAHDEYPVREMPPVELKGKSEPHAIFELIVPEG